MVLLIKIMNKYLDTFNQSIKNKEEFWDKVAKDVIWYEPYEKVLHTNGTKMAKLIHVIML